jgi:hypothetical protein
MATLYPKYIQKYSNTAQLLGTGGMQCKSIHSNDALEIEKCYFFGGYQGHRGANGVSKRTFRVYTGPKSAYYVLRQHEASLRSWIADEEARMSNLWDKMRYSGKSDDRIQPKAWGAGNSGKSKREHKERAARYIGHSYRRKEAKKALELQKTLNDVLQAGAGIVTPQLYIKPMLIDPRVADVQRQSDIGVQSGPIYEDYESGGNGQSDQYQELLDRIAELESWEDVVNGGGYMPSADIDARTTYVEEDEIPTWMWAVGGAGAAFVLYRMMKK